jgi:hypothetical protein
MLDRFIAAHLKIERADKHIADIEKVILSLPDAHTISVQTNPQTGKPCIKFEIGDIRKVSEQLGLIVGDAIHNLRTAIDYAWIGTIERHVLAIADNFSKFPVQETRERVEGILKGRKIEVSCPALYKLIVSDIKPYLGGEENIYYLHDLDIADKHLLLIPVVNLNVIRNVAFKNKETGQIIRGGVWATSEPGIHFLDFPEGHWDIEDNGQLAVAVIFSDIEYMHGMEVLRALQFFSKLTLQTVKLLEGF